MFLLLILTASFVQAQDDLVIPSLKDTTVIPGAEYAAGSFHRFFFGDHYRDLWTMPITVPVIDLNKFAGGLKPIKKGGGFQTKSLHFRGADDKYYKFRSINKDPTRLLPDELRETFVADVVQDFISTSHPLSAIIVEPILNAVDVLGSKTAVIFLPDDPVLGEYREEYKNLLGTIYENPKDNDLEAGEIFAGADRIENDYKIFEELDEDNDDQVHAQEYLKARLIDIFLGDWDRHVGQWKWARYKEGKKKTWLPIPRDRDQAFSRYDGIIPRITARAVPQIEHFTEDYPQVNDLTWSGRHLDRRFLMSIEKSSWDSVTAFVVSRLSDDVIEAAVKSVPKNFFEKEGENLIRILKNRRDNLPEISEDYYYMISKYVQIFGSDKDEYAEITRLNDRRVKVELFKKDNDTQYKKGNSFYSRIFNSDETKDIRIYLQGDDDKAVIRGNVDESIRVRVIGGNGADMLIDSSHVSGYFLNVTPIPDAENLTEFYDSGKKTTFFASSGTYINTDEVPEPKPFNEETDNINEKYEKPRDWGHDWKPGQWIEYNSDDGIQIGGGPILIRHDFRKIPYAWKMSAMAGFATGSQSWRFEYNADFRNIIENWIVDFRGGYSQLNFNRFYGFGNNNKLAFENDDDFYRISEELYYAESRLIKETKFGNIFGMLAFNHSDLDTSENNILNGIDVKGSGLNRFIKTGIGYEWDHRDNVNYPRDGFWVKASAEYTPAILDNSDEYSKAQLDAHLYFTLFSKITFAYRAYAAKIWNDFFITDAVYLGGTEFLRGYSRERFSGDAALFSALELRFPLAKFYVIIPQTFGLTLHAESGRVYNEDIDESSKWLNSFGGGIWTSYLNDLIVFSTTVSASKEDTQFYITTGFTF